MATNMLVEPQAISPKNNYFTRQKTGAPPSPIETKEFYIDITSNARGEWVSQNLSRAVVQNIRQYEVGNLNDKTDAMTRVMPVRQCESSPREVDTPRLDDPLLVQLQNRCTNLFRDAEIQGRLPEVINWLNDFFEDMLAEGIATKSAAFLGYARRLDNIGQTDAALDIVFDQIDEMLLAGNFSQVNRLLVDIAPEDYSVELLLGILTSTLPAKNQLPDRAEFYTRTAQTLQSRGELQEGLLAGLD